MLVLVARHVCVCFKSTVNYYALVLVNSNRP